MKRKTNEEIIADIMAFSQFGALAQAFVIAAVSRAAGDVSAWPDEKVAETLGMFNTEAWRGVAREIKAKLDEHYEPKLARPTTRVRG